MKILIDLDGVVADFVGGVCKKFNRGNPYTGPMQNPPRGEEAWGIEALLGIEKNVFWHACDYMFWANLKKTPEADWIIETCESLSDDLCFLSSPCYTEGCLEGKRDWVNEHYPHIPLLLACSAERRGEKQLAPKQFCAGSDSILIDDHGPNVDSFVASGGRAFLFPRPWNRHHDRYDTVDFDLREALQLARLDGAGHRTGRCAPMYVGHHSC